MFAKAARLIAEFEDIIILRMLRGKIAKLDRVKACTLVSNKSKNNDCIPETSPGITRLTICLLPLAVHL